MPAGDALINVCEGQPDLARETNVLVGGIVQRAVDPPSDLEARNGIGAAWTLKDVGEEAVPDGSLRAALCLHVAGGAGHCHKHLEIVLLPAGNVSAGVGGIDVG